MHIPRWIRVTITILVLIVLAQDVGAKTSTSQVDRMTNRKRGTCETSECGHLHYLENANCVNQCVSRKCYDDVYKGKELEDGEINTAQERSVSPCCDSRHPRLSKFARHLTIFFKLSPQIVLPS